MTVSYSEPWRSPKINWKPIAIGAAVLVAIAAVAAAAAYASTSESSTATKTTTVAAGHTAFRIASVSGAPGVPVQVPLRVTEAAALGAASLRLTYDPKVVTVVDVAPGDLAGSTLTWRHDAANGAVAMLLTTFTPGGVSGDATYAVVTLRAVEDAMGTSSVLALSVGSATTAAREALPAEAVSGSFRNGVTGDVTGNGVVDRDDYSLLSRYLVGEPVELLMLNADVDGDGRVTEADALALHQQIERASAT